MMVLDTYLMFMLASIALSLAPGPDNIFVLTQSALYGRKAGIWVTLGLCTGLLVHTSAVSLGVAAIFQTSEMAFNVLKVVGAIYLLYLAWQAFRASNNPIQNSVGNSLSWRKLYARGVLMNISNPKVAIFFLAFLPQFTNPDAGSVTIQLFVLGGLFIIATILIFGCIAWFSGSLGDWLRNSEKAQVILNRIAGAVFSGLAIRLIANE